MRYNSILETIGNTPHLNISSFFTTTQERSVEVWMKLERANPGGSIKDRIAKAMVEEAEKRGDLHPGMRIIEPTSGNTGIGLAMVAAVKNYHLTLVMPESMSIERRKILQAYGANLVLTPREKGMPGAIQQVREIMNSSDKSADVKYWCPSQFDNEDNVDIHRRATANEILNDFPEGINLFITGVGTGGHITGVAEMLKEHFLSMKVMAVEPTASPVLSGGAPSPHALQGIGAGFVPAILKKELIDEIVTISNEEAFEFTRKFVRKMGVLVGISTGAVLAAVNKKISTCPDRGKILTFAYDTGERYLSVENLF